MYRLEWWASKRSPKRTPGRGTGSERRYSPPALYAKHSRWLRYLALHRSERARLS